MHIRSGLHRFAGGRRHPSKYLQVMSALLVLAVLLSSALVGSQVAIRNINASVLFGGALFVALAIWSLKSEQFGIFLLSVYYPLHGWLLSIFAVDLEVGGGMLLGGLKDLMLLFVVAG